MRRAQQNVLARTAAMGIAALALFSCASIPPESIQPEPGYYYGIGSGASASEAAEAARRDLISNALTASRDRGGARGSRIEIGPEAARAVELPKLRPYAQTKTPGSVRIAYRLKIAEWDKAQAKREAAVRSEIAPRIAALDAPTDRPLAERMLEATRLLERLRLEGLTEILTETGPGSPLVALSIESIGRRQTSGVTLAVDPERGFIGPDSTFSLQGAGPDVKPLASLPIRAEWSARDVAPFVVSTTTGPDGKARLAFPEAEAFRNQAVRLTVSTNFGLKEIDARSAVEYRYRHFDDVAAFFSAEARVPGGPFTAGALPRDRRAARKEAPRGGNDRRVLIDLYPVTNALYEMFLEDTATGSARSTGTIPTTTSDDQPVIGVSWEEANRFAGLVVAAARRDEAPADRGRVGEGRPRRAGRDLPLGRPEPCRRGTGQLSAETAASRATRRSAASSRARTPTGSTTWPATSGSGRPLPVTSRGRERRSSSRAAPGWTARPICAFPTAGMSTPRRDTSTSDSGS